MSTFLQLGNLFIGRFRPRAQMVEEVDLGSFLPDLPNLQSQITSLTKSISDDALQLAVGKVMTDLIFLLDYLSLVTSDREEPEALNEVLSILSTVKGEAYSLVAFIENHAMELEGLDESLSETLDCTAYAIKHEVRRIFECELLGVGFDRANPEARGLLLHAQGVLTNCFQQCMIDLARVFDESLTGARLFPDWQTRRERSLRLCRDLSELIEFVHAGENGSLGGLPEQLGSFREGSMQCLMYKDWHQYEIFSDQIIKSIRNRESPLQLLHHLGCYLETLLGHVMARAVLADPVSEPFGINDEIGSYCRTRSR
jgi:hypothetical protein